MSVIELLILMERSSSRCCSEEFPMFPAFVDLPQLQIQTKIWNFCLPRAGVGYGQSSISAGRPKGISAPLKCCFHQFPAESVFKQSTGAMLLLWHSGETHPNGDRPSMACGCPYPFCLLALQQSSPHSPFLS